MPTNRTFEGLLNLTHHHRYRDLRGALEDLRDGCLPTEQGRALGLLQWGPMLTELLVHLGELEVDDQARMAAKQWEIIENLRADLAKAEDFRREQVSRLQLESAYFMVVRAALKRSPSATLQGVARLLDLGDQSAVDLCVREIERLENGQTLE